tara:strand:- start:10272 stop:10676 length:405 start_codon:yes stop_codon:yes gene_type:complete
VDHKTKLIMEKRKLKSASARRPKNKATLVSIAKEVSLETGFNIGDVKIVYRAICKAIKNRMWNDQSVIIPFLGTMMPFLKPTRKALALYGGRKASEVIQVPPKWIIHFVPMRNAKKEFAGKSVSKEQEDFIYES